MRRIGLAVTLLFLVTCSKSNTPTAPTPPPGPPPPGTAAAVALTPHTWEFPAGGGSLDIVIATSANQAGNVVAANVPVSIRASSGTISDPEPRTDFTGHARVTWSGTSSATITARAGDVETVATIRVQTNAPAPPPTPNPNPGPGPGPDPNPAPSPNPPKPPPPGRGPAGDLVAAIVATPSNPDAKQAVRFSATLTSSTGAAVPAIDEYVWDVTGDRLPDRWEASPSATYDTAGVYVVELELHTADNRAVNATLPLQVGAVPALTATLAASPGSVGLGETVTLTASATPTGNVGTLSYAWDFDGNGSIDQTTAANTTTTSYTTIGDKTPKVTVTGSRGGTATAVGAVTVSAPALTISNLTVSGTQTPNSTLTFTATVSAASGPVPSPLAFTWDYGNGSEIVTGPSPQSVNHVYAVAGTYTVKVTARATDGRTATNMIQVVVQ